MIVFVLFTLLTIFALLVISLPLFKNLDEPPTNLKQRSGPIDGLRGFLAFAVVVNHFDSNLYVIRTGNWGTYHVFDGLLGEVGVSLFFMITGFLFWGKLLASGGKTNWKVLYINRFFRIAPVYYFALIAALIIAGFVTHFKLAVTPANLFYTLVKWLFLGFQSMTTVNGFKMMHVIGVIWTLHYEWIFYFSLPFIAFFIRKKAPLAFCIAGLILSLIHLQYMHPEKASWPLFFSGMLCATLTTKNWKANHYPVLNAITACAALASVFIFFDTAIGVIQILLLLVFFFLITKGESDLFGLLALKGSKRISHISYSLYMVHMIVLYIFFNIPAIYNFSKAGDNYFWLLTFPCVILVLIASSLCYHFIEKNGVETGKKVIKKLDSILNTFYKKRTGEKLAG